MKGFLGSFRSYAKNVSRHIAGLLTRKETRSEARRRIASDTKKLMRTLTPKESVERQKTAEQYLKKGTQKYNKGEYDAAEQCFRNAIDEDPRCVVAVTYLGHTLYQKNLMKEAVLAWTRAYKMDPASSAGQKAMRKLEHVKRMQSDVLAQIRERLD